MAKQYDRERKVASQQLMDIGKMPPQAVELEEAVLGACMLERDATAEVIDILTEDCFYKSANSVIYGAILDLYKKSEPIDILTVTQKLKANGKLDEVGGAFYITQLTNRIASAANVQFHSRIVVQAFLKREYIRLSTVGIGNAYDDNSDVFDLYERGVQQLESCLGGVMKYEVNTVSKIHQALLKESMLVAQSGNKSGIPTGYRNIDNFTNGWQKTDLIIIAGRPGMGKSVCGLAFALNPALRDNIPTAVFSLEMSKEQVVGRAQATLAHINSSKIVKKQLTVDEINLIEQRCKELDTAPLFIDDTPSLSLMEFKGKARKLVKDKGVKLIVVDYLQLMVADVGKGNREQEISTISKGLKSIAKELQVPIIALSQLSRAVETRGGDKKPMLSDLRESGSIEQDADMVIFCYRPEYYGTSTYELAGETLDCTGLMTLRVAKHRAGSLGELRMGFNGDLTKLENYDSYMENKANGVVHNNETPKQEPSTIVAPKMQENTDFLSEGNSDSVITSNNSLEDDLPF